MIKIESAFKSHCDICLDGNSVNGFSIVITHPLIGINLCKKCLTELLDKAANELQNKLMEESKI